MTKIFSDRAVSLTISSLSLLLLVSALPQASAEAYRPRRSEIIKAFMYNQEEQTLLIYFLNGTVHEYQDVPEERYTGLKDAPLKGGYYNAWILDKFKHIELHAREEEPTPPASSGD